MTMLKLTGLDGEDIYVNPTQVTMVGLAIGQRPSALVKGQMMSEVIGTLVGVPGQNIPVKETREQVVDWVDSLTSPTD